MHPENYPGYYETEKIVLHLFSKKYENRLCEMQQEINKLIEDNRNMVYALDLAQRDISSLENRVYDLERGLGIYH